MNPREISHAIYEFRTRFLVPSNRLLNREYGFLQLYAPRENIDDRWSRYVDFTFSKDCGLLADQSILVDISTNYVVGIKPKDSGKSWFVFKDAQSDKDAIKGKIESLGNIVINLDVSSQYSFAGRLFNVGYAGIGNAVINMFKMDNIKYDPAAVKHGFDLFLLLVVEPARCQLLENLIISRFKLWLNVPLENVLTVARNWGGGAGPKDILSGSKVKSSLKEISLDRAFEEDKENINPNVVYSKKMGWGF